MWLYDLSNATWTWIAGSASENQYGNYYGLPTSHRILGSRDSHTMMSRDVGIIHIFGGDGFANGPFEFGIVFKFK